MPLLSGTLGQLFSLSGASVRLFVIETICRSQEAGPVASSAPSLQQHRFTVTLELNLHLPAP